MTSPWTTRAVFDELRRIISAIFLTLAYRTCPKDSRAYQEALKQAGKTLANPDVHPMRRP